MSTTGGSGEPSRATLQDVAARAGVSAKTVSNVVNGHPHVRPQTRERVLQAMGELHYRVNLSARHLARGRTGIVALAVPWLSNPYFAELAHHVIRAARREAERGESVTVLIDETHSDLERERQLVAGVGPQLLDGVIINPQGLTRADLEALTPMGPLVLLGERIFDGPVDHVAADNVAAARELTEHLLARGRRRIALVGFGSQRAGTAQLRRDGISQALEDAGLALDPTLQLPVEGLEREHGMTAARRLMARPDPPDAVVCFNDVVAVGMLKAFSLDGTGVGAGGAVSVAGFDNIPESAYTVPALTTVDWRTEELAETALEVLLDRIQSRRTLRPREITTPHRLVVRDSS
ncbi:LacI family DNA-binding transcriptional regulator [Desertihabitans aurantiacus]|uniref:LacI family DNA-binding transcriptional regulator n=1 Tax=Desertihabitans aurantiacus TaxID=2282477 RepID=UPI000DF737CE|nr:LacI family DNA-binding transcriptional regulator [Desertihabitans aurantiacus]